MRFMPLGHGVTLVSDGRRPYDRPDGCRCILKGAQQLLVFGRTALGRGGARATQ
jgi:hypothetical protein